MSTSEPKAVDFQAMMEDLWARVRVYNPQADEDKLWFGFRFAMSAHEGQLRRVESGLVRVLGLV